MDNCPGCGAQVGKDTGPCPSCGRDLREQTASFPPVASTVEVVKQHGVSGEGPVLVVRKGPEVGERFYLDRPRLTIGRDPKSDIFLNDITVSRAHAVLDVADDGVRVTDAGSLNGVYVNGESVDRAVLRGGDQLQIGRFQMVYLFGGDE